MINLKDLRKNLKIYLMSQQGYYADEGMDKRITIKRKKKMVIEQTANGDLKTKRRSYIRIEIIE